MQGLKYVDSRGLAGVMKDLGKASLAHRAFELFDLIRQVTMPASRDATAVSRYELRQGRTGPRGRSSC